MSERNPLSYFVIKETDARVFDVECFSISAVVVRHIKALTYEVTDAGQTSVVDEDEEAAKGCPLIGVEPGKRTPDDFEAACLGCGRALLDAANKRSQIFSVPTPATDNVS